MKRLPNNYGGVTKLTGKRSKPYMAWISQKTVVVGKELPSYYKDVEEVEAFVNSKEFKNKDFEKELKALILKHSADNLSVKRKKIPLGYFATRSEALNKLAEHNNAPIDGELRNITFAHAWKLVRNRIEDNISKRTLTQYDGAFKHCLSLYKTKVSSIKTADMQKCLDVAYETSPSVQSNIIVVCNYVFKYAMEQDIVSKNYASFLKAHSHQSKQKLPFTKEEIQKVYENKDWLYSAIKTTSFTGFNVSRLCLILIYTGMRIGELLEVKMEDIHLEERYIEVRGTKTKNANRIVPIHKDIEHLLVSDGEYLICDTKNRKMQYRSLSSPIWEKYCKEMGFNHTLHDTRHTFVTLAQECNLSPVALRRIVGHSAKGDITETVYTHPYIESLIKEMDKFSVT